MIDKKPLLNGFTILKNESSKNISLIKSLKEIIGASNIPPLAPNKRRVFS